MAQSTALYRTLIDQIQDRITHVGWTMERCDDAAGLQDGYTAKLLHPDTPSGRMARWETLQLLIDALFPGGMNALVLPRWPKRKRHRKHHYGGMLPLHKCPPHPACIRKGRRRVFSLPEERIAA
jgi:hypothetical protein